jgi:uncharacterized protein YndB with AHSA1/START domain
MTGSATAVVQRLLPAPAETVYETWLDAAAIAEFITPPPGRSGRIEWNPRVGAEFSIEMIDLGEIVRIDGSFLALERPSRLQFTWRSSIGGGFDSVVTVDLEPRGDRATLMTIEHARLPAEQRANHEHGWTAIAGQLASRLQGSATEAGSVDRDR